MFASADARPRDHAMSAPRGMTRRSLLAAGAAAAAGAASGRLARPGGAVAALSRRPGQRRAWPSRSASSTGWARSRAGRRRSIWGETRTSSGVEWPAAAGRGGSSCACEGPTEASARGCRRGAHGHGPDLSPPSVEADGRSACGPGAARTLELRAARALNGVRAEARGRELRARRARRRRSPPGRSPSEAASRCSAPMLPAGAGQPPIIARRAWAGGVSRPRVAPEYGAVEMAFVHHTENPNGYTPGEVPAMLRAIYAFHRYGNGWNDIGYNFVLDLFGRIFEARAGGIDEPVVGAQAGGYNLVSTGVAVLGELLGSAHLHRRRAVARAPVGVEAVAARRPGRGPGDGARQPGGRGLQPLSRGRARLAAAYRRPPRRRLDRLPRRRPLRRASGHPAGRRSAGRAPRAGHARAGRGRELRQAAVLTGALAYLDGTPIAGAPVEIQHAERLCEGRSRARADARPGRHGRERGMVCCR